MRSLTSLMVAACLLLGRLDVVTASPQIDQADQQRAREFVRSLDRPGEPGCALGVMRDGQWILKEAYGLADLDKRTPNTPELVFGIASITKQFTAAAAAIAAEQRYFSLDDDIRKYLPELSEGLTGITIQDLIHHTNGLRDHGSLVTLSGHAERYQTLEARLALLLRQTGTNFPAGTEFRYGNTGYLFLAAILERTTGQSLSQFSERNIFRPLGMRDTYFGTDTRKNVARALPYSHDGNSWRNTDAQVAEPADFGSGGLLTTLDDYGKWARNLFALSSPLLGGTRLTAQLRSPGQLRDGTAVPYAFGLRLDPYRGIETIAHSGSGAGYKALAMMFPKQRLAVIGFCNNGAYAQPVVMALADIYLHLPPESNEHTVTPTLSELRKFEGTYREPVLRLPMRVRAEESALAIEGDALTYRFQPISPLRFRNEENVVIEFAAAGPGQSPQLRQVQGRKYGSGVFERIEPVKLTPPELQAYTGDYYSTDLQATYRFTVEDGKLVARIAEAGPDSDAFQLQPLLRDEFVSMPDRLVLAFNRDGRGAIVGLKLTYQFGWITDLPFHRAPDPVAAWSKQHSFDPSKTLEPLQEIVGDARVLAFGEGTHNAHELWQWRNRLFRYAVEHLGFTALAAETGYAQAIAADDYVLGRPVPAELAVRGVFSWVDTPFEENRELLDWMRDWNARAEPARQVRFYGLEMTGNLDPQGALLVQPALDYLRAMDAKRAAAASALLQPLLADFEMERYSRLSNARRNQLSVAVQDLVTLFERFRVVWIERGSREAFDRAYRHAVVARQLLEHFKLNGDGRDIAAADNLRWVLEQQGQRGRVFLFAHNSHVAKWRKLPADDGQLHSTMVELARSTLDVELRSIGSLYDTGSTKDWLGMFGMSRETRTLEPSTPSSLNDMLARLGPSTLLLDLRALPSEGTVYDWFSAERRIRNINIREGYDLTRPARAFDALLFERDISPLRPLVVKGAPDH
ncbi:serine hydrolase [Steroidobacter sp.]|uniref:serine hydrolase n=1 Tax=Steroidobacter sp. TaxID=1978227 RepID=UPI001A3E2A0F|nr:serine hydrolase [Steroidobacter sp.]MBL8271137.1 serine hydrolase [Steroidobacter sp.]